MRPQGHSPVPERYVEGGSARFLARRIGEAQQPRCCAAPHFKRSRAHRHAERFPRGRVTDGNDSLALRWYSAHRPLPRGTRQMLTSEQMLFTVALFGHVLIAGIMLLIAVTLDDPTRARPPTTTIMRGETKRTKTSPTKPAVVRELDEVARAA